MKLLIVYSPISHHNSKCNYRYTNNKSMNNEQEGKQWFINLILFEDWCHNLIIYPGIF